MSRPSGQRSPWAWTGIGCGGALLLVGADIFWVGLSVEKGPLQHDATFGFVVDSMDALVCWGGIGIRGLMFFLGLLTSPLD